ncbi:uncharacterized protein V6R79_009478 [Siganus canaliculatus]
MHSSKQGKHSFLMGSPRIHRYTSKSINISIGIGILALVLYIDIACSNIGTGALSPQAEPHLEPVRGRKPVEDVFLCPPFPPVHSTQQHSTQPDRLLHATCGELESEQHAFDFCLHSVTDANPIYTNTMNASLSRMSSSFVSALRKYIHQNGILKQKEGEYQEEVGKRRSPITNTQPTSRENYS